MNPDEAVSLAARGAMRIAETLEVSPKKFEEMLVATAEGTRLIGLRMAEVASAKENPDLDESVKAQLEGQVNGAILSMAIDALLVLVSSPYRSGLSYEDEVWKEGLNG